MNFSTYLKIKIERLLNYEYWPYIIFYMPLFFYGIYLALKSGNITYFAATNPSMKYGGIMGESKKKILKLIDSSYLPKDIFVGKHLQINDVLKAMQAAGVNFPIVAKPDVGERGTRVERVENAGQLENYLDICNEDVILQEFVDYPLELGVLYYRMPGEPKGKISSLTIKKFLEITGDGVSTLGSLIEKQSRAFGRIEYLREKFRNELDTILPEGERKLLEPIGNHCRGTTFLDGSHFINRKLEKIFDKIAQIEGFYYGRFDLKVKSWEDLYEGKNIRILELNGVSSEPAHVYDPNYKLLKAYMDIARHMNIIFKISKINRRNVRSSYIFIDFIKDLRIHFKTEKDRKKKSFDFARI